LQAFSMTGLASPTVFTSRLVIDGTPSQSVTFGSANAARAPAVLPKAISGELPATGARPSPWGAGLLAGAAVIGLAGRNRRRAR
ncbi:MAG: hypothetical protein ACRDKS_00280, partial [Actinomycetota bacterium]